MTFQRFLTLALLALALPAAAGAQTKLLRFPDVYGDQVVFTYAGDLWLAPAAGGTAARLTAHPGLELFAKFSPDGEWIAFTGQYDGDEQVYVVPAAGGEPRLLTYYPAAGPLPPRWGYDNQVYGWTPDGSAVLFRSMRDGWDLGDTQLFTVPVAGGMPTPLPMPESGAGDFSPDGTQVVYTPLSRDFRAWKRYQGGWAQELYIFDLSTYETVRVTDDPRADRDPMWIGDTIYFTSDRGGRNNLYAYDVASGATTALTHHTPWDVRWPSGDPATGRIVYELDGELQIFDTASKSSTPISIRVPDDGVSRRPSRVSASNRIEDFGLSPKGERAVFSARGDIFSAPIEHGPTRNLTRTSGAHDREPAWSPDGKTIAFVSDADGEEEIWLVAQDGMTPPKQLTDGNKANFRGLVWSPDSKSIAFADQGQRLFVLDVGSGDQKQIADDPQAFGMSYEWSPRSGFLAYSLGQPNQQRSIYVWSSADGKSHEVTGPMWNEYSPTWDPEGDYLFFISDREFHPQIGSFEFNYLVDRESYLYAMALRKDVAHPFPPRSDEAGKADEGEDSENGKGDDKTDAKKGKKKDGDEDEGKKEGKDKDEEEPLVIDWDGLGQRIARVPVDADNYGGVLALEGHLLFFQGTASYYGRQSDQQPALKIFDRKEREVKNLVTGLNGLAVSQDRQKLLVSQQGNSFRRIDAKPGGGDNGKSVSTAGLQVDRIPREEWAQIFDEVWRRFRDFFYVENMHGYDWEALRDQYRPLLEHVAHRSDLNYVMSEMIAELSASHTYIAGGDWQEPERPRSALLGARFELDAGAGRYKISHVFAGDNAEDAYRSPLTEIGVGVEAGDYVLRINGAELTGDDNPYRLLRHAGGGPVELVLGKTPDPEKARTVLVDPIRDEDNLIYLEWIDHNRRWVDEHSGGRIGYLHLPNMGGAGISEWIKWYYGQVRKEGMIVDVRSNGGGNVSQMIIDRLVRPLLMVDFERNVDLPEVYPNVVFTGKLVCLLDEDTASDGDQFAYVFKAAGLGKLVGKRSWGGVVGIYGRGPLIDGGSVSVPEAGSADVHGNWVIEGHGVDPDIVVENTPAAVLAGRDPQLEKALEVVLSELDGSEILPSRPPAPVLAE
jgi:tricorn protease